jgi:hypothetical protein
VKGIGSVKLASASDSENPLGKALPALGLIAKAKLPPLNGRPERQFCRVIGGLNTVVGEESKQMGPVAERSIGSSAYCSIRAVLVFEAIAFHSSPGKHRGLLELPASDVAIAQSVPAGK